MAVAALAPSLAISPIVAAELETEKEAGKTSQPATAAVPREHAPLVTGSIGPVRTRFLALGVGKSVVIDLPRDVKDVLVADPKIANAVVRSAQRVYIIGAAVGQTNIVFFDSAGQQIAAYDIAVKRDLNGVRAALKQIMPNSAIQIDGLGEGVVLTGTAASPIEAQQAGELAAKLAGSPEKVVNSIVVRGRDQVMLKVSVVEMKRDTAKQLGRVSFNPLRHIDPFGTVILPGVLLLAHSPFLFGYARPVPVNFRNLNHPRLDMVWVALAGPASNVVQALLWVIFGYLLLALGIHEPFLLEMSQAGLLVNLVLFVLNMLPLPPLDGGRILVGLLPAQPAQAVARIEPFGFIIVLVLLFTGLLGTYWLRPLMALSADLIQTVLTPLRWLLL